MRLVLQDRVLTEILENAEDTEDRERTKHEEWKYMKAHEEEECWYREFSVFLCNLCFLCEKFAFERSMTLIGW